MKAKVHKHRRTVEQQIGKKEGFRVLYRNTKYPRGYVGMNFYAARELNIPFHHGKRTVVVWTGLNKKDRRLTAQHEITEATVMSKFGLHYHDAHRVAQTIEDIEAKLT